MPTWYTDFRGALLLCGTACAETVLTNTELEGHETYYHLYDREAYEAECEHPGQVVKLNYTTNVYDRAYKRYFYFLASDNVHQDLTSRYYLYNAFLDGLFKD